jgi:hypothetical protein
MLSGASFIGTTGDMVTIRFKKKCLSVSTARTIQTRNQGTKRGSLKDFEVCDIPEKELLHNGQKVINPIGTVICPK